MQIFAYENHEPSLLPDGNWKLVWNDEFDGDTLDLTKWDYRLSMMQKRHPVWSDKALTVENSMAVFHLMLEDGTPVSSQLQTGYNFMDTVVHETTFGNDHLQWPIGKLHKDLFTHRYGYYECRCRLQQKEGWWSAFWMQSPVIGASNDPKDTGAEIDIMECFDTKGTIVPHNAFAGGYGEDMTRFSAGGNIEVDPKEFHRFGMKWDEEGYTFYIDGVEDGHVSGNVSGHPEFILISTEVKGARYADHKVVKEAYDSVGDTFLVDYVRVFDAE